MLDLIADRLVPTLLASPVLSKLANLQSSLDPLDIEGLANIVSTSLDLDISDPSADLTRLGPQPSLEEWKTFLSNYSSSSDTTAERDVRHKILSYLLSATFKDCSIIVSYSTDPETNEVEAKVRAIDLDPKPIGKSGKWLELDKEIVECWGEMVEGLGEEERANLRKCNG
jgi:inositol-pentakisphosphate 2-kinase